MKDLKNRITFRLFIVITLVTLCLDAILTFAFYQYAYQNQYAQQVVNIQKLSSALSQSASEAVHQNNQKLAKNVIQGIIDSGLADAVELRNEIRPLASIGQLKSSNKRNIEIDVESPILRSLVIGHLIIHPNAASISDKARIETQEFMLLNAFQHGVMMILMLVLIRIWLLLPIFKVIKQLHKLKLGTTERIEKSASHQNTEIGTMVDDVNFLLGSVENLVNEERELQNELSHLQQQLKDVFEQAVSGNAVLDRSGIVKFHNPAFETMMGESICKSLFADEPKSFFSVAGKTDYSNLLLAIDEVVSSGKSVAIDLRIRKHQWLHCIITNMKSASEAELFQLVLFDVTERRQRERRLQDKAELDALTGIYNRGAGEAKVESYIAEANTENNSKKYAFMMIDLDGFKPINDQYGHEAGDEVLIRVANRISRITRAEDLVIRWGGDEFAVFIEVTQADVNAELSLIAKKILKSVQQPVPLNGSKSVNVGCSIGISLYPMNNDKLHKLIKYADLAMYEVKTATKNDYSFFRRSMLKGADVDDLVLQFDKLDSV